MVFFDQIFFFTLSKKIDDKTTNLSQTFLTAKHPLQWLKMSVCVFFIQLKREGEDSKYRLNIHQTTYELLTILRKEVAQYRPLTFKPDFCQKRTPITILITTFNKKFCEYRPGPQGNIQELTTFWKKKLIRIWKHLEEFARTCKDVQSFTGKRCFTAEEPDNFLSVSIKLWVSSEGY